LRATQQKSYYISEVLELRRIGLTNRKALLANWVDEAHEKQSVANSRNQLTQIDLGCCHDCDNILGWMQSNGINIPYIFGW
jgi:hypothetical protein